MALSQPRSETKIDEAAITSKYTQVDDDLGSLGDPEPRQDDEVHHKDPEQEPLSMWRTHSVPSAFQGRNTSSFISRFVRCPLHASLEHHLTLPVPMRTLARACTSSPTGC